MEITKEQKEAIEYYQNKEVSLSVDFDTENLLKALGITEEDSFENHQIRFKTLLNLIEKLQKENEELKEIYRSEKKMKNEYIKLYQDLLLKENVIPIQKIKDKIEELNKKEKEELKGMKGQDRYFVKQTYQNKKMILQELIKESEE